MQYPTEFSLEFENLKITACQLPVGFSVKSWGKYVAEAQIAIFPLRTPEEHDRLMKQDKTYRDMCAYSDEQKKLNGGFHLSSGFSKTRIIITKNNGFSVSSLSRCEIPLRKGLVGEVEIREYKGHVGREVLIEKIVSVDDHNTHRRFQFTFETYERVWRRYEPCFDVITSTFEILNQEANK